MLTVEEFATISSMEQLKSSQVGVIRDTVKKSLAESGFYYTEESKSLSASFVYQNKHDSYRSDESEKEVQSNGARINGKNGTSHLNNLFCGRSTLVTKLLMICVYLVFSLETVSAAPSFFDEYGRAQLNPLHCGELTN